MRADQARYPPSSGALSQIVAGNLDVAVLRQLSAAQLAVGAKQALFEPLGIKDWDWQ